MAGKNIYNSKILCGNWFEERCTSQFDEENLKTNTYLPNPCILYIKYFKIDYDKYRTSYRDIGSKTSYQREKFSGSTDNWLNFQPKQDAKATFATTAKLSFVKPKEMKAPFSLKHTALTKDPEKLEEYRSRWTNGHSDFPRTYLGAIAFKKAEKQQ